MKCFSNNKWHAFVLSFALLTTQAGIAHAVDVHTIQPSDDAYVSSTAPDSINNSHQLRIRDEGGEVNRSFLNFDLFSVTEEVRNAYIEFHRNSFGVLDVVEIDLWRTEPNWSETELTWNNQPPLVSRIAPRYTSKSNFVRYDVTKLVAEKKGAWMSVALSVEADPHAETPQPTELAMLFHSTGAGTPAFRPKLVIETTEMVGSTFSCARVMGFSQTVQWFNGGGFLSKPGIDPNLWEANAIGGCGPVHWLPGGACTAEGSGGSKDIWSLPPLYGACAVRSGAPDRLVLAISGNVGEDWEQLAKDAVDEARVRLNSNDGTYQLNPQRFYLLPVVGGINNAYCGEPETDVCEGDSQCVSVGSDILAVRATYNNPEIASAMEKAAGSKGYEDVYYLHDVEVACDNFDDAKGHFDRPESQSAAADAAAALLSNIE